MPPSLLPGAYCSIEVAPESCITHEGAFAVHPRRCEPSRVELGVILADEVPYRKWGLGRVSLEQPAGLDAPAPAQLPDAGADME